MKNIIINPSDNVAVSLDDNGTVPRGHKFALRNIAAGENIIKYGMPIGHATAPIKQGDWVHTHNLKTNLSGILEYQYKPEPEKLTPINDDTTTFDGYVRKNGSVGIRNRLFIVPTVGCVNSLARTLAMRINAELPAGCDTAIALEHPGGCSQLGEDHATMQAILAGWVHHPNAGGVLVLGLGCENNTMDSFRSKLGEYDEERVRFIVAQQEEDELEAGMKALRELAQIASQDKRVPCPLSKLVIGLKCGGSDGLSGITANPLVGSFSDYLIARGGSAILSEVPEMFGSETLLFNRCCNKQVYDKAVAMINDFKNYFTRYGQVIYENPSPGNKEGGISTLEDKSLGCTQKAGAATVQDVISAGEHPSKTGLNLLSGPGNDMVASTLLGCSGAQLILFTTGRGTPFGTVVPTIKIATNSALASHKPNWIDFNAGKILDGQDTFDDFRELVLAVCSGKPARNELNSCEEISLFKDGVTL